jgi:hypothetical protein
MIQLSYENMFLIIAIVLGGYGILIHQLVMKCKEFNSLWVAHLRTCDERNNSKEEIRIIRGYGQ